MSPDDADLRAEIRKLRGDVAALDERLSALEARLESRGEPEDAGDGSESRDGLADPADEVDRDETVVLEEGEAVGPVESDADREVADSEAENRPGDDGPADGDDDTGGARADAPSVGEETARSTDGRDWELDVGTRWFAVVGVIALVVGVGLFARYAIQQGAVGYLARVVLGALAGIAMVVGGRYAARTDRYARWGRIVAGGGLAITYVSVYAAYGFEAYREAIGASLGVTLVALTAVVAGGAWLSVRDDSRYVAGESFLLGFATATIALELGSVTLAYGLVLTTGLVAVVLHRGWTDLAIGGVAGSYWIYAIWWADAGSTTVAGWIYLGVAFAAYLAVSLAPARRGGRYTEWASDGVSVLNALAFGWAVGVTVDQLAPDARSVVFLGLAGLYVGVLLAGERTAARENAPAPYLSVLFLVLAIAVGLDPFPTTVALAATLVALVIGALAVDRPAFRNAAHGVAAILFVKTLTIDVTTLPSFDPASPLSASRAYALLVVAAAFAVVAWRLSTERSRLAGYERWEPWPAWVGYAWFGQLTAAIGLALALDHRFWTTSVMAALLCGFVALSLRERVALPRYAGYGLTILLVGKLLAFDARRLPAAAFDLATLTSATRLHSFVAVVAVCYLLSRALARRDMIAAPAAFDRLPALPIASAYAWLGTVLGSIAIALELSRYSLSAAWALYALALLGVGIGGRHRALRLQAMALLALTTGKVFLVDTSGLEPIARALSFLTLGAILLLAAFAYARYADRLSRTLG